MPDGHLRAIEAVIPTSYLRCAVARPAIAALMGRPSSLDLGRSWQRGRPFFLAQQGSSMVEVVAAFLGLCSAGIFLAYAVEAYRNRGTSR
jgi:hypothetical protein